MTADARPLATATPESAPFWDGCRRHELLLPRCDACGLCWFPPGPLCPECWSTVWQWVRSNGRGTVHSFVVYHRVYHAAWADAVPYVVAVVGLDEGPRLTSNIVECDPSAVHCDMPVEVAFEDVTEFVTLPKFRPIRASAARFGTERETDAR